MATALRDNLLTALPLVARLSGGTAVLADGEGRCLFAFNRRGDRVDSLEGVIDPLCRRAAQSGRTLAERDPVSGVEHLALPIGDHVLATSNDGRIERQNELFNTLKETLPLIARVAGGEAVLFDHEGRRILTADPTSGRVEMGSGEISEPCGRAMRLNRPDIGTSRSVPGAMAVRIPLTPDLGFGFNNANAVRQKERLLEQVKSSRTAKYGWEDIVGASPNLGQVLDLARTAAERASSVLVVGESGTGKELFAQAIHNASVRSHMPFVAINCSALPESLVESTLFGYVEGAFTGAHRGGRAGLFEQANGGTLLLDEISEMPYETQAKLLRVIQEREVCRIGAARPLAIDVRIIATSNRDLAKDVRSGRFRQDLFYRLNVIDIHLPPLRERKDDIPFLARAILESLFGQGGAFIREVHPAAMRRLMAHDWPGNVRELRNAIERAVALADGDVLHLHHLGVLGDASPTPQPAGTAEAAELSDHLAEAERLLIIEAMKRNRGHRRRTAAELGISVTTLWRRLRLISESARSRN